MLYIFFKYFHSFALVDFVPRCIYFMYSALVECWACKWFALSLLTCMSGCSFQVWMSIVVTILKWLPVWSSHGLFLILFYLIALCLPHMPYKFSAYNDQIVLLCFKSYLFIWFKSISDSKVRCKWVLFNCFQLTY